MACWTPTSLVVGGGTFFVGGSLPVTVPEQHQPPRSIDLPEIAKKNEGFNNNRRRHDGCSSREGRGVCVVPLPGASEGRESDRRKDARDHNDPTLRLRAADGAAPAPAWPLRRVPAVRGAQGPRRRRGLAFGLGGEAPRRKTQPLVARRRRRRHRRLFPRGRHRRRRSPGRPPPRRRRRPQRHRHGDLDRRRRRVTPGLRHVRQPRQGHRLQRRRHRPLLLRRTPLLLPSTLRQY
mmetsp:Transcript_16352/g.53239  ORF Transcript_16352/g.53239 Transcript_16352/m.53239 type:complete len:235 (-) Transcript_16352:249-953(-)